MDSLILSPHRFHGFRVSDIRTYLSLMFLRIFTEISFDAELKRGIGILTLTKVIKRKCFFSEVRSLLKAVRGN